MVHTLHLSHLTSWECSFDIPSVPSLPPSSVPSAVSWPPPSVTCPSPQWICRIAGIGCRAATLVPLGLLVIWFPFIRSVGDVLLRNLSTRQCSVQLVSSLPTGPVGWLLVGLAWLVKSAVGLSTLLSPLIRAVAYVRFETGKGYCTAFP